jgi:hypothetical protein
MAPHAYGPARLWPRTPMAPHAYGHARLWPTRVYGSRGAVAPRSEVEEHAGIAQRVGLHSVEVEELGDPLVIGAEQFLIHLV